LESHLPSPQARHVEAQPSKNVHPPPGVLDTKTHLASDLAAKPSQHAFPLFGSFGPSDPFGPISPNLTQLFPAGAGCCTEGVGTASGAGFAGCLPLNQIIPPTTIATNIIMPNASSVFIFIFLVCFLCFYYITKSSSPEQASGEKLFTKLAGKVDSFLRCRTSSSLYHS